MILEQSNGLASSPMPSPPVRPHLPLPLRGSETLPEPAGADSSFAKELCENLEQPLGFRVGST